MKKIYMTMVAMLCGVAAMAQDGDGLYVNDIKVEKGTTEIEIPVCLKNELEVGAVSFRIGLPEGFSIPLNKRGKFVSGTSFEFGTRAEDWGTEYTITADGPQVALYDKIAFEGNDGELIILICNLSEEIANTDAEYTIPLTHIGYASPDAVSYVVSQQMTKTETSFKITIGKGTGISSINAEDVKAPVYNLAGQRVSKAQKGVFIQNGKKVAVK